MAISQALIPVISKAYSKKKYKYVKKKTNQACLISLLIGFISTLVIYLFPNFFFNLLFNTTDGINYFKVMAPFILIFYIEGPITSALQAINEAKEAFKITFRGTIYKSLLLFATCFLKIGIYPLIISTLFNIYYVTYKQRKLFDNIINKKIKTTNFN